VYLTGVHLPYAISYIDENDLATRCSRRRTLGGPDNNLVRTKPLEDGISNDPFEGLVLALEEENKGCGAIPRLAFRFLIG
jgi:hypothetical protein